MEWIKDLFGGKTIKKLEQELSDLKRLHSEMLIEKQEQINKTNAYWKKKMRDMKDTGKKTML